MKQWRNLAIVALAAAGLVFSCNAQAKADDADQFLIDAHAAGFTNQGGNQALITVGETICTAVGQGESQDDIANELWHISQLASRDMARALVTIAMQDLCPST